MALPELTKTYAAEDISVIVNGIRISGLSGGVKIKRSADAFTKKVGVDGSVARAKNPDRSGEIEIPLLGTSASNDFLSALALNDEVSGVGYCQIQIKDLRGTTTIVSGQAWVKKLPDLEFGAEVPEKRWLFECSQITGTIGGNI